MYLYSGPANASYCFLSTSLAWTFNSHIQNPSHFRLNNSYHKRTFNIMSFDDFYENLQLLKNTHYFSPANNNLTKVYLKKNLKH